MKICSRTVAWLPLLLLGGCTLFHQNPDEVLVREPGRRVYAEPASRLQHAAPEHWEYAAMSENAYFPRLERNDLERRLIAVCKMTAEQAGSIARKKNTRANCGEIPLPNQWTRWQDFPRAAVWCDAIRNGLSIDVYERVGARPALAVVFRGTEFSDFDDWESNLRWFLRFVPAFEDQYTVVAQGIARQFAEELKSRFGAARKNIELFATGHSLGGGLAQQFAYSFPSDSADQDTPRVKRVYAFDPSPVTGWFAVKREIRERNAKGLHTSRIFEHGEALAYVRLLLSYVVPPSESDPAISEIRYNVIADWNIVHNHSMRELAREMVRAVGGAQPESSAKCPGDRAFLDSAEKR